MGPTGPCGPCTEIHYDLHPERGEFTFAEGAYDEERVIEFWNLVFMESNRDEDGTYEPLPMQSVDTGLGLDRMALIKAGRDNIFQTGLFEPILIKTASMLDEDIIGNLGSLLCARGLPLVRGHRRSHPLGAVLAVRRGQVLQRGARLGGAQHPAPGGAPRAQPGL